MQEAGGDISGAIAGIDNDDLNARGILCQN